MKTEKSYVKMSSVWPERKQLVEKSHRMKMGVTHGCNEAEEDNMDKNVLSIY